MFHMFQQKVTGVLQKRVAIFRGSGTHGTLMIIHISLEGGSLMTFACEKSCGFCGGGNSHNIQHQPQKYQKVQ